MNRNILKHHIKLRYNMDKHKRKYLNFGGYKTHSTKGNVADNCYFDPQLWTLIHICGLRSTIVDDCSYGLTV